jgi:hypothetical protein
MRVVGEEFHLSHEIVRLYKCVCESTGLNGMSLRLRLRLGIQDRVYVIRRIFSTLAAGNI